MSTSPSTPSPSATGGSSTAHTQGMGNPRRGSAAAPAGTDLFSNLLSLLSTDTPAPLTLSDLPAGGSGAQPETDPGARDGLTDNSPHNPLAALLAWTSAITATPTGTGAEATAATEALATDAGAALPGAPALPTRPGPAHLAADTEPSALSAPRHPTPTSAQAPAATVDPSVGAPRPTVATEAATPDILAQAAAATSGVAQGRAGQGTAQPATANRITAWRSTTTLAAAAHGAHHPATSTRSGESARLASRQTDPTPAAQAALLATADAAETASSAQPVGTAPGVPGPAVGGPTLGASGVPAGAASGSTDGNCTGSSGSDPQPDQAADARDAGDPTTPSADNDKGFADWTSPHVRHASVRVGEAGDNPIDIQLSLDGQEVQVRFQTNDAQARDSLERDASAALGELLQRSGMELGSVSVGGQSTSSQGQAGGQGGQPAAKPALRRSDAAPEAASTPPSPRRDDSRPLDLFV